MQIARELHGNYTAKTGAEPPLADRHKRRGEREVDVIEHATIARARLARRTGHEPFGEGRDRGGILGVEERASPPPFECAWSVAGCFPFLLF